MNRRNNQKPRCPIHNRVLICPACIGSKGGKTVTPKKLKHLRRASRIARQRARQRKLPPAAQGPNTVD